MVQIALIEDEEVPQDIDGFFGHPLNSSFHNNDSAKALLHEYKSLPAIDKLCADNCDERECIEVCEERDLSECIEILDSESSLLRPDETSESNQYDLEKLVDKMTCESQMIADDVGSPLECNNSNNADGCENVDSEDSILDEALDGIDKNILHEFMDENSKDAVADEMLAKYLDGSEAISIANDCNNNDLQPTNSPNPSAAQEALLNLPEDGGMVALDNHMEMSIDQVTDSSTAPDTNTFPSTEELANGCMTVPIMPSKVYLTGTLPMNGHLQQGSMQSAVGQHQLALPTAQVANQNEAAMTYPMMPQFMSPMVVQTSTAGALQIQPVILNNRDLCFTQPIPYHPHAQPHAQPYAHMGMPWNPAPFYHYNMGHRMMCPDGVRLANPHQMYYPHGAIQMMQPHIPVPCNVPPPCTPLAVPTINHQNADSTMQPHVKHFPKVEHVSNGSLPKLEPKMIDQSVPPNLNGGVELSQNLVEDSETDLCRQPEHLYSNCSQSNDALQRACVISNIPHISNNYLKRNTSAMHLKSPDSGFGESHLETVACSSESELSTSNPGSPSAESHGVKRRRKSMCNQSRLCSNKLTTSVLPAFNYVKRENDDTGYEICMEASTSCGAKLEDDRMTYLNKGQYYKLEMRNIIPSSRLRSSFVKSVITLRFREENSSEAASKYWQFWHTHQSNIAEAKGLDIDIKGSKGIIDNTLEYNGINSLTFAWDTHDTVQAQLAVHCLSTDFSSQKGVKGLPLHIQIDTYDGIYSTAKNPIHRAYAQIKIFCEKGAERKARDEEKRKEKSAKPSDMSGVKQSTEQFHPIEFNTQFYTMEDLSTEIFAYRVPLTTPELCEDPFTGENVFSDTGMSSLVDCDFMYSPNPKRVRLHDILQTCIYVRETQDVAFTALHLATPTAQTLSDAIKEKYDIMADIGRLYKRTSRGMLVKIDDSLVKHFLHESMYVIEFKEHPDQGYDVTLTETDL